MTSKGVTAVTLRYWFMAFMLKALDFKANYVKVVESRPIVFATKKWCRECQNASQLLNTV